MAAMLAVRTTATRAAEEAAAWQMDVTHMAAQEAP
jgi:hypothetical protein